MSAMRCSADMPCRYVRSPFCRLIVWLCGLAWVSRNQRDTASLPATIAVALSLRMWQWMSTANHLPRACAGPGNRPGIPASPGPVELGGRQVNSIGGLLDRDIGRPTIARFAFQVARGQVVRGRAA